jgi:hypothetical protein
MEAGEKKMHKVKRHPGRGGSDRREARRDVSSFSEPIREESSADTQQEGGQMSRCGKALRIG